MTFTLAISPCPNDTFIFEPLLNRRIDLEGHQFNLLFADIDHLNRMCIEGMADICKISTAAYPGVEPDYQILSCGAALGYKNGPLLVSKKKIYPDELYDVKIAIPGETTTANKLLEILYPEAKNKTPYLFSEIEEVILSGEQDAGLIIHENRFTYNKKGLRLITDLGENWEKNYHLPLPLGNIVIRNNLPAEIKQTIHRLIRTSIKYSMEHPESGKKFITQYAQNKDEDVIDQHIQLYVNNFTIELGNQGKEAICTFLSLVAKNKKNYSPDAEIFIG